MGSSAFSSCNQSTVLRMEHGSKHQAGVPCNILTDAWLTMAGSGSRLFESVHRVLRLVLQRSNLVQTKRLQESSNLRIASDQLGLPSSLRPSVGLPAHAAISKPHKRLADPLLAVSPSRNNAELQAAHASGASAWSALPSLHWERFLGPPGACQVQWSMRSHSCCEHPSARQSGPCAVGAV